MAAQSAAAVPVNGTGFVTPDVIFGSGNANGSFSGDNSNGVVAGLRAKLRYDSNGNPTNTFNYDGDHTYRFNVSDGNAPGSKSF